MLAQYLGAFLGAALVFFTYKVNASADIINFHSQVSIIIFMVIIRCKKRKNTNVVNHRMQSICTQDPLGSIRSFSIHSFVNICFFPGAISPIKGFLNIG